MNENDESARFEMGASFMETMHGPAFVAGMRHHAASDGFGSFAARMAVEQTFGDIWSRPGMAPRDRSLVVLAILLAQGHMAEFKAHIRFGLNNGLTTGEIEELLYQAQPYAGWGCVSQGIAAAIEVLRERGEGNGAATAEERGML